MLDGGGTISWAQSNRSRYRAKWTGLGIPAPYDLCATPPHLDAGAATFTGPAGPAADTYTFHLDSVAAHAGPRYGVLSLVRWTYSDGAPADTGFTVVRRFTTPAPVRVTCTVFNNLGCTVAQELLPLGPCPCPTAAPAALPAPAGAVWPNPSVSGVFWVRGAAGTRAVVTDAVGRAVWTGTPAALQAVDLSAQPAGVYALRLTWADGRTQTRRLVR